MKKKKVTGSIRPRPSKENVQYYTIVLELGRNPVTNKRDRINFRIDTDDYEEAEKFLQIKLAEYLQDELLMPSDITVCSYLDEFLELVEGSEYSPATVRDYECIINRYLKPVFGKIKLQNLQKSHIQKAYNDWRKKSNASGNPLSASTIQHINRVFKTALNEAVDRQYIKINPTLKIKIPKGNGTNISELEVYTVEEIRKLQQAVKGTDMELPVALLFDCVMRRGELLGLRYSDINFDTSTVTIRNSLVESNDSKTPVLKNCKTDNSCREIVISKHTLKLLKKYI